MPSQFGQYQGGIKGVQGLAETGANIGKTLQQGMSSFGSSMAEGIKAYNENQAKDQVLQEEAKALGMQIQQFAAQFGDSPEHKQFADSLQPYIQQLAKVPSMSLTQKMGAVTGVKAAFGNIGQQLQVFEMMRKERMARDMNAARGGVREFDEQTVPTAIIPSGKLPYFYGKNYTEQESELVRLTNEAKAKGANVDLPKVLNDWRSGLKANAMSRPDLPPQIKEALVKQIDAGEGLTDNIQTDQSGVTDYAKEAEMYEKTSTSVKEQLAPQKVEAPVNKGTAPDKATEQTRSLITDTISKLEGMSKTKETLSDSEFNKLVAQDPAPSRYTKVANLETQGWKRSVDDKGKVSWSKETENKQVSDALAIYKGELDKLNKPTKEAERATREESDKKELTEIDSLLKSTQEKIDSGESLSMGEKEKLLDGAARYTRQFGTWLGKQSAMDSARTISGEITDEVADRHMESVIYGNGANTSVADNVKNFAIEGIASSPAGVALGITNPYARKLTVNETKRLEAAYERLKTKKAVEMEKAGVNSTELIAALNTRKTQLQNSIATGIKAPTAADMSKAQQATAAEQPKPEQEYTLTNQYNMTLGTTTGQVATSLESKRKDMKAFFQNKYGYIPASFEESFKATYPEANFKTMETAYGAFMWDGKDWKQIQMKEYKPPSRKELAEEKAVSFGKLQPDSSIDINEFGELVPNSGVYVRGIFGGTPTEAFKFRTDMLEGSNAKKAVARLTEINDMVGESMPWNSKVWGEAKALLPQIKAGLRTDIIGVGTVSNYEQELINDVVADPTKFWSLEASDRAKIAVIMDKISNKLVQAPANYGLEVRIAGKRNEELERGFKMGRAGKSKLELDFEARGGKKGVGLNWNLSNKIPDALKN
jgi:hypothetical protein